MADERLVSVIYDLLGRLDPGRHDPADLSTATVDGGNPLSAEQRQALIEAGPAEWTQVRSLAELDWAASGEQAPWLA